MSRPYHSPSSMATGVRCQRLWAYEYLERQPDDQVTWSPALEQAAWCQECSKFHARGAPCSTGITAKQKGGALGGETHKGFEAWYGGTLAKGWWATLPGRIALSGAHLLPHPSRVTRKYVEHPIGNTPVACGKCGAPAGATCRCDRARVALEMHGIKWVAITDLLAFAPSEMARLGIDAPDGWCVFDHKTTANVEEYALTPAELLIDVQANLNVFGACELLGLKSLPGRWNYFETKKVRRAEPRDVTIFAADALDVMKPYAKLARELDTITRLEDAPQNPHACCDFGPPGKINCPRHVANGGTCDARRSIGALVQARLRKETTMALTPEMQAKFDAMKNKGAAATAPPPETEAADTGATGGDAPPPPTTEPAKRKFGGRKPGEPVAGATTTSALQPAAGGLAATIAEIGGMLAAAEQAQAESAAQIATCKEMLRAAIA